ncbi:MAG: hypothetical protein DSZ06_01810 [Sulfurospirillum sp.]|nr:MAG: hypothetical protein DSZ06_01810 [Sulfurospirillum sp.]
MSKLVKIIVVLIVLILASLAIKSYLKDKVPSIKSDLTHRENRMLLYDFLKINNKKAVFCDLILSKNQNESFLEDLNSSNYIHFTGLKDPKVEYRVIFAEDGKKNFIYNKDDRTLKGLFIVDEFQNEKNRYINLLSINPSDLKILNNF